MKRNLFILFILVAVSSAFTGCSPKEGLYPIYPPFDDAGPRLVISGTVTDTAGCSLPGIYVAVYEVREANEPDILSYNCAVTDSVGQYMIIRYRGREVPVEVSVVAVDSLGIYEEQVLFAPVTYDFVQDPLHQSEEVPYNGFVTADFVMVNRSMLLGENTPGH